MGCHVAAVQNIDETALKRFVDSAYKMGIGWDRLVAGKSCRKELLMAKTPPDTYPLTMTPQMNARPSPRLISSPLAISPPQPPTLLFPTPALFL